ncbi:Amino acid transporter AVT6C-like protein [Drosera capensis]
MKISQELANPLLHPERRTASVSGAVFNVSTSTIGAGIMSIPATFKVLGVVPAFSLIVIVAVLVDVSAEFLVRFADVGDSRTYAGSVGESFGRVGALLVQICIMITNLGCLIVYQIIIGDVLSGNQNGEQVHLGVLQEWFGFHWWNTRASALLLIMVFILLPLVMFRRVDSLRFTSAISLLLAVVFVGISSVMAIHALLQGKTESPKILPDLSSKKSFLHLFTAAPVIVSAFTFHFNLHPIGSELRKPSETILAVKISLVLCAAIYFAVGFLNYLLFGESTMPDILVNFDRSSDTTIGSLLNDVVRLSYALHLVLVFPLLHFSLRSILNDVLFPRRSPISQASTIRFVSLSVFLLTFSYLAAIAIPNIWYFFQFMGSTFSVSIAFIFPAAITLRDVHGISTRRDKIIASIMIILALVTSAIAITTNLFRIGDTGS